MSEPTQNLENHKKTPTTLIIYSVVLSLALLLALASFFAGGDTRSHLLAVAIILCAGGAIGVAVMARYYALALQDRIIRLEMQVRLARVLPADLQEESKRLTLKQLIGLRFAGDAELPELVRATLKENPQSNLWIKKQVKNWQPDHQRV